MQLQTFYFAEDTFSYFFGEESGIFYTGLTNKDAEIEKQKAHCAGHINGKTIMLKTRESVVSLRKAFDVAYAPG